MIIIMIVSFAHPVLFSLLEARIRLTAQTQTRSNRQRLRPFQIRRLRPKSLRRPQLALVRRAPHLLRTQPRDRFPRGLLPAQQRRRVREGWVLQFHPSQGAEWRVGEGVGVGHEEVVEGTGEG